MVSVNDQFQVTDWAFATPPSASRDVNAIVFAKKRIWNSLQLAIGGFDSASALTPFLSDWANHCRCYKAELRSASTIPGHYVQWRLCGGDSATQNGHQCPGWSRRA